MPDPVDELFKDLVKDYPGKLPPIQRRKKEEETQESLRWDHKPVVYNYGGVAREFFTIRHLSAALGRSQVTIRSWENKGVLPKTPFRSPAPRQSAIQTKPKGKRLWTREQIEGLIKIAEETGCIIDDKQSPPNPQFTDKATQLFIQVREKEAQK